MKRKQTTKPGPPFTYACPFCGAVEVGAHTPVCPTRLDLRQLPVRTAVRAATAEGRRQLREDPPASPGERRRHENRMHHKHMRPVWIALALVHVGILAVAVFVSTTYGAHLVSKLTEAVSVWEPLW